MTVLPKKLLLTKTSAAYINKQFTPSKMKGIRRNLPLMV